jgi:4-hydroxybenzoate polyprenyltransferase/phosphoserine phosphatase
MTAGSAPLAPTGSEPTRDLPLVVDLDGTLISGDLLHETATRYLVASPLGAAKLLPWTLAGAARLKTELASRAELDVTALPYRPEVLEWLRQESLRGREIVLASASHESLVDAVAAHVGVFSDTIGTTADRNLRSEAKAAALVERYGHQGFEYVGNHRHDLEVWREAAAAHIVTRSGKLSRAAGQHTVLGRTFEPDAVTLVSLLKSLRPHQWVKNLLVLLPLFTAQLLHDVDAVVSALLAFVSFCLVASSVYVLNDLADLDNDRHHPKKRRRPFAAGTVSLLHGWMVWPVLTLAGFAVALVWLPWTFTAVLLAYYVTTVLYTFTLKRSRIVDVVALAALYTLRVIAGVAAISATVSMWLLTFSLFLFLSLALIKRVSELTRARREGASTKGRGYIDQDLELLSSYGVSSSIAAAVIFSLYVNDPNTQLLYQTPQLLWAALPILLTWLMRAWLIAHRGEMNEDPILFAIRDRKSLVGGFLVVLVFVAAKVVSI